MKTKLLKIKLKILSKLYNHLTTTFVIGYLSAATPMFIVRNIANMNYPTFSLQAVYLSTLEILLAWTAASRFAKYVQNL